MTVQDVAALCLLLSDESRLRILLALQQAPTATDQLSRTLRLAPSTVSFHLKKLQTAGLVAPDKRGRTTMYQLCHAATDAPAGTILSAVEPDETLKQEEAYRQKVIRTFLPDGQLTHLPAQLKKKVIVCEEIAQRFEKGRTYTEREVNEMLLTLFDDFCTLRRELVDTGVLTRDHGVYQRTDLA